MGCLCARASHTEFQAPLLADAGAPNASAQSTTFEALRANSKWSNQLKRDAKRDAKIKKLLLLGPGNSGKSTFFKQLLRIHGGGFSDLKKQYFGADIRRAIYDNIVEQISAVILQCRSLEYKLDETEEAAIAYLESLSSDTPLTPDVAAQIKVLWQNESVKMAYDNRTNLSIVDSSAYFFDELERIASIDYTPTEKDILLVRTPTTGIISAQFSIDGNVFDIYDAGGQKCERSKWIHCFDNVTAVLFMASLSCFDQGLYENVHTNALHETLRLWDEILNSRWFRPTAIILFLNKSDLFRYKLEQKQKKLHACFDGSNDEFDEYKGDDSFDDGVQFILSQFLKLNRNATREIYHHVTCATDKDNVERVFNDVQNIVVNAALKRSGLV
eukprot:CAMPEP_0202689840 /NCGR_PEP_ID=MMETSP1385-20130828/5026_1 /ASSEMBLY_ACC=CAM_ASM_000861 /TAXON_ID=933848 /ORGANISM="Elphidium margaritaceum" /LENGTH=385 /DNA_ID=CAMNT_0049345043 /DNA_START=29 /DNA_END=1186 /DNA_ORIENTATION=+